MSSSPSRPIPIVSGRAARTTGRSGHVPSGLIAEPPPIDIHEEDDALVLEADLPGVEESSIVVAVEDHVLTLRGTAAPSWPDGVRPLWTEFRPRELLRSFILGAEIDRGRIEAELRDGVLRIRLPKAERPPAVRIRVTPPGP
jgi:HSP20 family protein